MWRVRVLIADDHPEMLSALISVVESDSRFVVVGTATSGPEAYRIADQLEVDLALLDVHMPGGGPAVAERLRALAAPPVVVAISADSSATTVEDMKRAGAVAYLTKGRLGDALPDLLARCAAGDEDPAGAGTSPTARN